MPVRAIKADADGAGYSWATMRRVQNDLGVTAVKGGMKAGWMWSLPGQQSAKALKNPEDAQQYKVSTFGESEHLRRQSGAVEVEICAELTGAPLGAPGARRPVARPVE